MKIAYLSASLLIIFLFIVLNKMLHRMEPFSVDRPFIWMYWETLPNKEKPGYIDLCIESIHFNCGNCFTVIVLNEKTIWDYLPEIQNENMDALELPQKVDYYRYCLLEKYGGIWLDADILVIRCICPLYKKLEDDGVEYVGAGCGFSKKKCRETMDGKGMPLNWLMMSKPHTPFMKCVREKAKNKISWGKTLPYHSIGKVLLKECLQEHPQDYYHISSECQEYDSHGVKLNNILVPFEWEDCKKKRYFFPLYNTAPHTPYPESFKRKTAKELKETNGPLRGLIDMAFSEKGGH